MEKKNSDTIILGILNIISGLLFLALYILWHLPQAFRSFMPAMILGISYIVFAISVFLKLTKLKWLFYLFIIPLMMLCLLEVIKWNIGVPDYYRFGPMGLFIFIGIPLITCLGNVYFLTRFSVK